MYSDLLLVKYNAVPFFANLYRKYKHPCFVFDKESVALVSTYNRVHTLGMSNKQVLCNYPKSDQDHITNSYPNGSTHSLNPDAIRHQGISRVLGNMNYLNNVTLVLHY